MRMLFALLALLLVSPQARADTPQSCTAFTPTLSCNTATGEPVVTLTNTLNGSFDPNQIRVTSLTEGVAALANPANPLALQLTGAHAGQSVALDLAAIAQGGGSTAGLDKCCMGALTIAIPPDFTCERPPALALSHVCTADPVSADAFDIICETILRYSGAAPTATAPLTLTTTETGDDWTLTDDVLASDNWSCPTPAAGSPITCQIDATRDPFVTWQDFTSTLITKFRASAPFETCAASGTAQACWSTDLPRLHLSKSAPETCPAGAPCSFTLTLTNPSTTDYTGPLSIQEAFRQTTPPTAGLGAFTAITPPLCALADLNAGLCAGEVSLPAGATQTYAVDWLPPDLGAGYPEGYSALNCAQAVSQAGTATGDDDPFGGIDGLACATAHVPATTTTTRGGPAVTMAPDLRLTKTAAPCDANKSSQSYSCPFTLSLTNMGSTPFNGPLDLTDRFGDPQPVDFTTASTDWTCTPNRQGALCDTSALSLPPNASTSFDMTLTLPALAKGGSFTNCAALGLTPDALPDRQATAMVQRLLLAQNQPIGRADGQAGAKTRAAVADLQTGLGLDPNSQIDAALLTRLFNAATGPEACVTVDLPPLAAPPLRCDKATTTAADGSCACRYSGMNRAGKSACTCAKGSRLVAGKGCVKAKTPPKTPPKTPTKPEPQQIPLRFCPNGLPEIPGIGCVNINIHKTPKAINPNCNPAIKGSCP
ncbi:MAG: peptidoglycan-binding domain-containing protein [Cypionkella sp.]